MDPLPPRSGSSPEAVFDRLYAEHRSAVQSFFYARTGDAEAALDLLGETFLRVWRHLPSLERWTPDRRRYWIFAVARNLLTDHYRRSVHRSALEEEVLRQPERYLPPSVDPMLHSEQQEEWSRIEAAIGRLPEAQRTVLIMSALGEMKSGEIADLLGKPAGTVRYLLSQARARLKTELQPLLDPTIPEAALP